MGTLSFYCKGDGTYHYKSELPKSLQPFVGYLFSSGSIMGDDAKSFLRKYRNAVVKLLPEGFTLYSWHPNHYCASGVIQTPIKKFIDFSIPDIRYGNDEWYTNILFRKMKHETDWCGEQNQYTSLFNFTKNIKNLY